MASVIQGYLDPGTYQQEVLVPGGGTPATLPLSAGLIGLGSGVKRAVNEAVIRGKITAEPVTFAGTPKVDTLVDRAYRRQAATTLYKNGVPLQATDWLFQNAFINSNASTAVDTTIGGGKGTLTLSLDGRTPIAIEFSAAPATPAALLAGTTNRIVVPHGAVAGATTLTELAAAINSAFLFATAAVLGVDASQAYGVGYGAVATIDGGGKLVITSIDSTAKSDVAVWASYPTAGDLTAAQISFSGSTVVESGVGGDNGAHAKTVVQLVQAFSNTAAYTIDYVSVSSLTLLDALVNTGLQTIVRVGDFQSVTTYNPTVDFTASGNNISWTGTHVTGVLTGLVGTYDLSTNATVSLSLDGKATIDIVLTGLGTPPPGYVNAAAPAAATAAEVANNINAVLAASSKYGTRYRAVASVVSLKITLTSPNSGQSGIVEVDPSLSGYAGLAVFGLQPTQLPYSVRGTGQAPVAGNTYYATYDYTRPASDYNHPKQYFRVEDVYADIGNQTQTNFLAIAARLAFQNGAPSVFVVQVDDRANPGVATQQAYEAALAAAGQVDGITEFVLLDPRSSLQVDLFQFLITQNSPTVAKPCRGWYGMPKGTVIGDRDTPGTFIYTAAQVLFSTPDSPGRGRSFLMAPDKANTTITLADGSSATVTLDGTFLAAAMAGAYTARASVADAMVNSTLLGFDAAADNTNTFPIYLTAQRKLLAAAGVWVLTNKGGKIVSLDPVSTERANGAKAEFEEPALSSEKDATVAAINQVVNGNLVGVTPADLADFVLTVKQTIGSAIQSKIDDGSIGPYKDTNGRTRRINYSTDIQVFQSAQDPRKFIFNYFFNGRYPAKYFFGNYSVDNPFFTNTQSGLTQ